jgi:hypothetical protein
MKVEFAAAPSAGAALAVAVYEQSGFSEAARRVDGQTGGGVARALQSGRFTGAKGQSCS